MNMALTYCNSEIAKRRKQVECALCTGTEMTANATNRRLNSCRQSWHFADKHWFLLAHLSPLKLFLSPPLLTGRPFRFPGYFHRLIFTSLRAASTGQSSLEQSELWRIHVSARFLFFTSIKSLAHLMSVIRGTE